jgi:hypothetical protein
MRARYLIRDMANGDPAAWRAAEQKLQPGRRPIHEDNRRNLIDAMATLPDPRKKTTDKPDAKGRRFAVTVHAGEDWAIDPPVLATGFDYTSPTAAQNAAFQEMWRQFCLGTPRDEIGAYVTSNDATEDQPPSVEDQLTLPVKETQS